MTSPADKATDDVRGLVERLTGPHTRTAFGFVIVHPAFLNRAASTLTSLLERAERAERGRDEARIALRRYQETARRARAVKGE